MRTLLRAICCAIVFGAPTSLAFAHEFWLDPESSQLTSVDGPVQINTRVGENFRGSSFPYNPNRTVLSAAEIAGVPIELSSRIGDRPALQYQLAADANGLFVAVHQTKNDRLTYKEFEKFQAFVDNKDLDDAIAVHIELDFPRTNFVEDYGRYGKTLIAVGDGVGSDRAFGLEVEIVALANPYTDSLDGTFPVRSLYQGVPRANSQVEVFERAPDGAVRSFKLRTDAQGEVSVPVQAGHEYLVDAVKMRTIDKDARASVGAIWESLWASLTFSVPVAS